jgi:hypothetical protein
MADHNQRNPQPAPQGCRPHQNAVTQTIGELLSRYTAEECANYFKNSGYAPA